MNLDFHVHGILSKKLNFDTELFISGINFAKNNGLDGFILCEHFNAVDIDSTFSFLEDNFTYENDRYDVNGFYVYLGMCICLDLHFPYEIILILYLCLTLHFVKEEEEK